MLKAHIDKEIIVDAYREFKKDWLKNPRDFLDFLRQGSDLIIYGNPNQNEKLIISDLLQGRGDALISKVNNPLSESQNNINPKNPYQVIFFNTSDEIMKTSFRNKNRLLSGFIDDYKEVFAKLSKTSYFRVGDAESPFEFSEWSEVLPDLPVTDIIITDPYIFKDSKGAKPINKNYYRLLDVISKKYDLNSLMVFSTRIDQTFRTTLIADSKRILGDNVSVDLLAFEGIIEHDRYIFMNYKYINTGGSMTFYNDEGAVKVSTTSKIEVLPICNDGNFIIAQDILRRLFEEMERLKNEQKISAKTDSRLFFYLKDH